MLSLCSHGVGCCRVVLTVAAFFPQGWRVVKCDKTSTAGLILWIGVLQRVWPRIKQALNILLSNYQITSRITSFVLVEFLFPFSTIVHAIASVANAAFDEIPSVACMGGGGFFSRLVIKVSLPAVLLLCVEVSHRARTWNLVHRRMPISPSMRRGWRIKIGRALIRSRFAVDRASWALAIIYLLYPSTSSAILDTFYCRKLTEGGYRVLMADYSIVCFQEGGKIDPVSSPLSEPVSLALSTAQDHGHSFFRSERR